MALKLISTLILTSSLLLLSGCLSASPRVEKPCTINWNKAPSWACTNNVQTIFSSGLGKDIDKNHIIAITKETYLQNVKKCIFKYIKDKDTADIIYDDIYQSCKFKISNFWESPDRIIYFKVVVPKRSELVRNLSFALNAFHKIDKIHSIMSCVDQK